jgi:hypothetical protein
MGLEEHFLDEVTIERSTRAENPYGNAKLSWEPSSIVRGRLVQKARRVWSDARQEYVVVSNPLLLLPAGTDVIPRDRVVIGGITYHVDQLLERRAWAGHHLSLMLSVAE